MTTLIRLAVEHYRIWLPILLGLAVVIWLAASLIPPVLRKKRRILMFSADGWATYAWPEMKDALAVATEAAKGHLNTYYPRAARVNQDNLYAPILVSIAWKTKKVVTIVSFAEDNDRISFGAVQPREEKLVADWTIVEPEPR